MPITRIPERYRFGLAKICTISDESFLELEKAIQQTSPYSKPDEFSEHISAGVKTVETEDVKKIIQLLFSLYVGRAEADVEPSTLISALVDAMRATGEADFQLSPEGEKQFKDRISRLLAFDSLNIVSKAQAIRRENDHNFCEARVLSDIRTVFAKPEEQPIAGLVSHVLKIEYHESGDHKSFYVSLDDEDLGRLKKVLERAELKAKSLKLLIENAGIKYLD